MPIKTLQRNERVAEVQFICDSCGKIVRTSLIPQNDVDAQKKATVTCWQCKQANPTG